MYDSTYVRYPGQSKSETESRMVVARCWRGVGWDREVRCNGYNVPVLQDEEFWKGTVVMVAQQYVLNTTELYT